MTAAIAVAGIDPTGGAGLAADQATLSAHGCVPWPVKTGWAAQDGRRGLVGVTPTSPGALAHALHAALAACPGAPVKVGMLGDAASVVTVATCLHGHDGPVIVDPVMGPSAGGTWADDAWLAAWRARLAPLVTLATPNLAEARRLVGAGNVDPVAAAQRLQDMGCQAVVVTGGDSPAGLCVDHVRDHDNWCLAGPRLPGTARGTGCRFAAASVAALATGDTPREAIVRGRIAGTARVAGTPADARWLPWAMPGAPDDSPASFPPLPRPLGVCPLVATPAAVASLAGKGVDAVQLRLKAVAPGDVPALVAAAAAHARAAGMRLFVNDHWQAACALPAGAVHGVHLGQEDLHAADLARIRAAGLHLGVSAHNWHEAAVALAARPSYISYGPVFPTTSKVVGHPPLGIDKLTQLCTNLPVPAMAIGGLTVARLAAVAQAGASGVATIGASATPAGARALVNRWRDLAVAGT